MDITALRNDTPGCEGKLFLNSAGSSLPTRQVVEKMQGYLGEEAKVGGYELATRKAGEIAAFYSEAANLLHCKEQNIAFAYNASDAYARALSSIPFERGDCILTTNDDYISNQIAFLSLQKRFGARVLRVNNLDSGDIDLMHAEEMLKAYDPVLVAVTHIPTNSGLVQDVVSMGDLCMHHDAWYLVDACQSTGQLPVDVQRIGCDFLSTTGRKFLRGPRGTGLLYISDEALEHRLEPLFIDMRGAHWVSEDAYEAVMDGRRFEMWEFPYSSLLGLAEAIRYANETGIENIYAYNQPLVEKLRTGLCSIPGIRVLDKGTVCCNIVTFSIREASLTALEYFLKENRVYYSVSLLTSARIDFARKKVEWAIRFSPHYFNTPAEIDAVLDLLDNYRA